MQKPKVKQALLSKPFVELCSFLQPPYSVNSDYFCKHFCMQLMLSRNPNACISKQTIKGQGKSELIPNLSFGYPGVPCTVGWDDGAQVSGESELMSDVVVLLSLSRTCQQPVMSVQGLQQSSCLAQKYGS